MDSGVNNPDVLYPEEVRKIVGCAMTVIIRSGLVFWKAYTTMLWK